MGCCDKKTKKTTGRKKPAVKANILKILKANNLGIKLDVGCGASKQEGFVGLDILKLKGVDIVHNAEETPYPLPDECCSTILCSHLVEHICPQKFISCMNEWWRLLKVGGQILISLPYAGSHGYWQDPTHCNGCNESTWQYFSPYHFMYRFYRPKPWKIERNSFFQTGNMEVILKKISEEEAKKCEPKQ